MLVNRCASKPPVQLSAAEMVALFSVSNPAITSSIEEPSLEKIRSVSANSKPCTISSSAFCAYAVFSVHIRKWI